MPIIWACILGVKFWEGGGLPGLNLGETRPKNVQQKIADEFAEKFAGNLPNICQIKKKTSHQIRSGEPRGQNVIRVTRVVHANRCVRVGPWILGVDSTW